MKKRIALFVVFALLVGLLSACAVGSPTPTADPVSTVEGAPTESAADTAVPTPTAAPDETPTEAPEQTTAAPEATTAPTEATASPEETGEPENGSVAEHNCRLIVKDKDITEGNYVMLQEDHAELPFVAILTALGADIQWQSETVAAVTYNGTEYTLDTAKCELLKKGSTVNQLSAAPGAATWGFRTEKKELILDNSRILLFLSDNGLTIQTDRDAMQITIR